MVAPYTIEDLIEERNTELYDSVQKEIDVILNPSDTNAWSSQIKQNNAVIAYSKSRYPQACFTHELLHLKLELDGLCIPFYVDNEKVNRELIPYLFNQFVHHKMYPLFLDLGYKPYEFLHDADDTEAKGLLKRSISDLEELYEANKEALTGLCVALPYLVIKSPHEISMRILKYERKLRRISNKRFLDKIDALLDRWAKTENLDVSLTFAQFFNACGRLNIGFSLTEDWDSLIRASEV